MQSLARVRAVPLRSFRLSAYCGFGLPGWSRRGCSTTATPPQPPSSSSASTTTATEGTTCASNPPSGPSLNSVTLVGVVHDIQSGYVFEDAVTQFTLTTTSLDSTSSSDCVVTKDHHTIRCFGEAFCQEVKQRVSEGNVISVSGRLRLNPQLETSCNRYYYFPFIHVQPPHGQVAVVYGDRRAPPTPNEAVTANDATAEDVPTPAP